MAKRQDYTNEVFGTRKIIRNYCVEQDWVDAGLPIRKETSWCLGECLNCGHKMPVDVRTLKRSPPKRCSFCSGISNKSSLLSIRNQWTCHDTYAVLNIMFKEEIVSTYIDLDNYEEVKKYQWRISQKRNKYYVVSGKKDEQVYLHQLIYGKPPAGYEIDHIDGNSLNNRKANLRYLSRSDNARSVGARIDNQIGIRGISFNKKSKRYAIDFSYDHTRYYVKPRLTIEEAVWCRYCFEKHFGLTMLENNPLFEQYNTLPSTKKQEISLYIEEKISEKSVV